MDTGEPLMEVPLKDLACILGLLSAAVETKLTFEKLSIRLIEIRFLLNPNMCPISFQVPNISLELSRSRKVESLSFTG